MLTSLITHNGWIEAGASSNSARLLSTEPGVPWNIAQHAKDNHNHRTDEDCGGGGKKGQKLPTGAFLRKHEQRNDSGEGNRHDEEGVKRKGFRDVAVQELVGRPQSTAAGAIQAGGHFEKTAWIKSVLGGIEEEKKERTDQAGRSSNPNETNAAARPFPLNWRNPSHRQLNADFTSGLARTIKIQMPIGKPTQQQDEVHGSIERIVAVITSP